MIRTFNLIALVAACGLAVACQPQKTPEQIAQEEMQKQMTAAMAGMAGALGANGPNAADSQQAAAAFGAAMGAAMNAAANDPSMTAEERAKAQRIMGAMASGNVHPAASAYLGGLNKAATILGTLKDQNSAKAAEIQLAPIFAEMQTSANVLNAMSPADREVAMGSAAPQLMQVSMTMMTSLMPLMANPEMSKTIDDLMSKMPDIDN